MSALRTSSLASSSSSSSSSAASSAAPLLCVRHVLVVGGSGFIGSAVCRSALRHGLSVSSLSSSGVDPFASASVAFRSQPERAWTREVRWLKADLLDGADDGDSPSWKAAVQRSAPPAPPVDAVVCCVGGFGSVAFMQRVNGEANVRALQALLSPSPSSSSSRSGEAAPAAAESALSGVRRVGFVSAYPYRLPTSLQRGYIEGKRSVEAWLQQRFPHSTPASPSPTAPTFARSAVVVQPGAVYGPRYVRSLGLELPLHWLLGPLHWVTSSRVVQGVRQMPLLSPVLTPLLLPPTPVDALADLLIERLVDPQAEPGVTFLTVDDWEQQQSGSSARPHQP